MWQIKKFKTAEAMRLWVARHENTCQITELFICNGYAVEYRRLRIIG